MARQRGFQPRGPRRKTAWSVGPHADGLTLSAEDTPVLWTSGVALTSEPEATIVRIRGFASIGVTSISAAHSGVVGAVGLGVTTAKAFAIGTTACPGPVTEVDWEGWMWHHFFVANAVTGTIADGVNAVSLYQRFEIDSKAMRFLNDDMILFGSVELETESGTAVSRFDADCRILLKLP